MPASVRVLGAQNLRRTLRAAGTGLGELKDAHARAAKVVEPVARAGAPVVSGTLAGTVRSSGTNTAAIVRAGYQSVPYAGPIHWGWPARNIEAQPFIYEAAQRTEPRWLLVYRTAVDRILSRVRGV